MRKNWVLRLGLLAMVLTLVTMPMVSSTYAKYVTEKTGTDTARVAKWGVDLTTNVAGVFSKAYKAEAAGNTGTTHAAVGVTVDSTAGTENLLAPGTNGSFTFSITGKPEVSVNLSVASAVTLTGWQVNSVPYEPIKFTLLAGGTTPKYHNKTGFVSDGAVLLTASELVKAINDLSRPTAAPLTDLTALSAVGGATGIYTVGWEWPFEGDDAQDTALGNAGTATLKIDFTITATQID